MPKKNQPTQNSTHSPSNFRTWLNAYVPPLVWAVVIFLFSSQATLPGFEVSSMDFLLKKSAHMFVYAILYLLLHRAVSITRPAASLKTQWALPLVICLLYAISDEIHQTFVPNRYGTIRDIGYDMLGASIALLRKYRYI